MRYRHSGNELIFEFKHWVARQQCASTDCTAAIAYIIAPKYEILITAMEYPL